MAATTPGVIPLVISDPKVGVGRRIAAELEPLDVRSLEVGANELPKEFVDNAAVVIATPDPTHAEVVEALLEIGRPKAMLVEKPLTSNYASSQALAQRVEVRRIPVWIDYLEIEQPVYRAALAWMGNSRVEEVVHFRTKDFVAELGEPARHSYWPQAGPSDAVHDLSQLMGANLLGGRVVRATAKFWRDLYPHAPVDIESELEISLVGAHWRGRVLASFVEPDGRPRRYFAWSASDQTVVVSTIQRGEPAWITPFAFAFEGNHARPAFDAVASGRGLPFTNERARKFVETHGGNILRWDPPTRRHHNEPQVACVQRRLFRAPDPDDPLLLPRALEPERLCAEALERVAGP